MPLGIFAWVLWLFWVILGGVAGWRGKDYYYGGANLLLAIVVALILWAVFGPLVK